jgi:hypothetical protein
MSTEGLAGVVSEVMGCLADLCQSCLDRVAEPYLVRVSKRGLTGKYRCPCGAEWNCWWAVTMAPKIRGLAVPGCCGSGVMPYEVELDYGRARVDWECPRCGKLWSSSDQAPVDRQVRTLSRYESGTL